MKNEVLVILADDVPIGTLMAVARGTGLSVGAVVVGGSERAKTVANAGVRDVKWFSSDENTPAEAFITVIANAITEIEPRIILATNTAAARVILGAIAARSDAVMTSSVVSVILDGGNVKVERSVAERRAVETVTTDKPVVAFVIDGADDLPKSDTSAPIEEIANASQTTLKIVATHQATGSGNNLANAERVVGAGRGIVSKEELAIVEQLADALNAEMACSLSLCDDYRWFEHSRVVGTSTQRISPRLYVSVGISGQPQHMTGVRGAKTIVAINNDPEAPIFRSCAYGIVGDLTKIVPALTAALAQSK